MHSVETQLCNSSAIASLWSFLLVCHSYHQLLLSSVVFQAWFTRYFSPSSKSQPCFFAYLDKGSARGFALVLILGFVLKFFVFFMFWVATICLCCVIVLVFSITAARWLLDRLTWFIYYETQLWGVRWHSGHHSRFPPLWPGIDSQGLHMGGDLSISIWLRGFFSGYSGFPPSLTLTLFSEVSHGPYSSSQGRLYMLSVQPRWAALPLYFEMVMSAVFTAYLDKNCKEKITPRQWQLEGGVEGNTDPWEYFIIVSSW